MHFDLIAFVRSRAAVFLVGMLLILMGASVASSQELPAGDLRINQVAHFGGDAFYCVDGGFIATTSYPDATADGGFRLLDSNGQELWFVPAALINAAVDEAKATGKGVLVANGRGTYGPVALYTYVSGNVEHFVLTGYDEFGKPNSLDFTFCTPVGPNPETPGPGSVEEDPCFEFKKQVPGAEIPFNPCCITKSASWSKLADEITGIYIPCCLGKLVSEVSDIDPCCVFKLPSFSKLAFDVNGSYDPCIDCKVLAAPSLFYRNVEPRYAC